MMAAILFPCRVLSLTNQETADNERRIREYQTGEAWEYHVCGEWEPLHWHVQPVRR